MKKVQLKTQTQLFSDGFDEASLLSALIKSIRLRRTTEAAIWLTALWRAGTQPRARAQRRILIAGAEDNMNIAVMRSVTDWFNGPDRMDLFSATRELARITKTPNWYAFPNGRTYIRSWLSAENHECKASDGSPQQNLHALELAVKCGEPIAAMQAFNRLYRFREWRRSDLAALLTRLALERDNRTAHAIAEIYEENARHLWNDGNYSGQALYVLLAGPICEAPLPDVDDGEVLQLTSHAKEQPLPSVPDWCRDGIHLRGNDPRFSGSLKHMAIACSAFERFSRLSPDDNWSGLSVPE